MSSMKTDKLFYLLIVDDDPLIHQSLKMILPPHWKPYSVHSKKDIDFNKMYHLAFVDMHLKLSSNEALGLEVVESLSQLNSQIEIVAMSGDLSRELMESCLKKGAQRFLSKPLMQDEVLLILDKVEALFSLRNFDFASGKTKWIGQSQLAKEITKKIASLKGEQTPVLIEAETGSGKEVAAKILHEQEPCRPFITVNIASIPEALFESEMFGHIKGAFTGADQNKIGLAEAAHGGDLFLDEIEALPIQHQVKLLRFLESGEIRKVGAKDIQKVKTRVIVASNRPLEEMVKTGEFREDLFFRISAHRIQIPPLRERTDDIPELAQFFLTFEKPKRNKSFTDDGYDALKKYKWPGNVRELKRVCEQLSLTSPLPIIRSEDVHSLLTFNKEASNSVDEINFELGLTELLLQYELKVMKLALKHCQGNVDDAAKLIKVSRSTLYKKVKDYQLE